MFKTINNGTMPTKATKYSAAVDAYSNEDIIIPPGETAIIGLGIYIDEDQLDKQSNDLRDAYPHYKESFYIQLSPRSSLRAKGLISGTAIIDLDYTGSENEIKMIISNPVKVELDYERLAGGGQRYCGLKIDSATPYKIFRGDRIGQLMLLEHKTHMLEITSTSERTGGLGSTGK